MIPSAIPAPTIAPQASTAPATVVPMVQQGGLSRAIVHGQPAIESQKSEAPGRRRKRSDEQADEGDLLAARGFAEGFRRARLFFREEGEEPVVVLFRDNGREREEMDVETFAERARAQGRPRPGLVLDAYY